MELIKRQYVVNDQNQKVAVQIDLQTFQQIEEVLENYGLIHLMAENEGQSGFELKEALAYYQALPKAS